MFGISRGNSNSVFRKSEIETKGWFLYKWEIATVVLLAIFAATLNQIPNWAVKPINGKIDPILSYPLRDNIIYSSFSIFVTIGIAIFIGVFTELGQLAGKYGSTIFVLVPSFVWLLSDRAGDNIEDILAMSKFLGTFIFWSILYIGLSLIALTIVKFLLEFVNQAQKSKLRIEFVFNYINRFSIVVVNILIVLMLGYAFINYGIFSLHLSDRTPDEIASGKFSTEYNLHSESFTTYIGVIAVVFALLMIIIGLSNIFNEDGRAVEKREHKEQPIYEAESRFSSDTTPYGEKGNT